MEIKRALSIKQPWCWLIMNYKKDIEVRTWNTLFRGYFALHASKIFDDEGFEYLTSILSIPSPEEYQKGVICGYAYLYDVKKFEDKNTFILFKDRHLNNPDWWGPSKTGFVLQDVTAIPPIISKGKLGLYALKTPFEVNI